MATALTPGRSRRSTPAKSNREAGDGRYDIWMERNGRNYIFELKMCDSADELEGKAELALRQIDEKRYGAELDRGKPLWKVGIAFFDKQCRVKCEIPYISYPFFL